MLSTSIFPWQLATFNSFDANYKKYHHLVRHVAQEILHDREQAEDVTQLTFEKFIKQKKHFKTEEHIRNWLMLVARTTAIDELRKRRDEVSFDVLEDIFTSQADPEESAEASELHRSIMNILDEMKPEYSQPLYLWCYFGFHAPKISKIMGVPYNTLRSRLQRGRATLRDKLTRLGYRI